MKNTLQQQYGHPRFYEITEDLKDLYARKNSNYSKDGDPMSNFRGSKEFNVAPYIGVLIRMSDKWNRIQELSKGKPDRVGESLYETIRDLVVYGIICLILLEEFQKEDEIEVFIRKETNAKD